VEKNPSIITRAHIHAPTPLVRCDALAHALGIENVYLKRDDLHALGSHKGRSVPTIIDRAIAQGMRHFVISSSGNAALAAALYIEKLNQAIPQGQGKYQLIIFVGTNIEKEKLVAVQDIADRSFGSITIAKTERPLKALLNADSSSKPLRQSTDDSALIGYETLGEELTSLPNLGAIFIPTSSGTTAQALGTYFARQNTLSRNEGANRNMPATIPQIHVVQTDAVHPIAEAFDPEHSENKASVGLSLAHAIVDRVAHRKEAVIEVIHATHGAGWIVSDERLKDAQRIVKDTCDIEISYNSALSVAGLIKALEKGWKPLSGSAIVCLITGK
jgi:threonine synthase